MANVELHRMTYLQQNSTVSIHIGPWVFSLALFQEHIGYNLVKLGNQLKHGVIGQMLQGKLALAGVTRVSLPQDSVAIAWHHLQATQQKSHLIMC